MHKKCEEAQKRFIELEGLLAESSIISDQNNYQKLAKEYSDLTPLISSYRAYLDSEKQIKELKHLLKEKPDREFKELVEQELAEQQQKKEQLEIQINDYLNPKKQEKDRDLIIEIRAGTGGQEASLFAADLYRMYTKYADTKGWKYEVINCHESETGGFKEIIFSIRGRGASRLLKFESGAHRVQRVPVTEASGRIHTSAATVAVLFEPDEVEIKIDPKDLRIDIFRSSGPGGQSVNTTDSAVRITHLPTGIVVSCQDERSQLKNKSKAMRVLRARLHAHMLQEQYEKESRERKLKVGTGDRSEKIRTYNYPERRVTDHRIGLTIHQLPNIMDGNLDQLTEALNQASIEESIRNE